MFGNALINDLKTLGGEHSNVATSYNNIGMVWKSKGNNEKALEYYILSAQIRFKKLGADHKLTKITIENAKRIAKSLGKENDLPEWMNSAS